MIHWIKALSLIIRSDLMLSSKVRCYLMPFSKVRCYLMPFSLVLNAFCLLPPMEFINPPFVKTPLIYCVVCYNAFFQSKNGFSTIRWKIFEKMSLFSHILITRSLQYCPIKYMPIRTTEKESRPK